MKTLEAMSPVVRNCISLPSCVAYC